MRVLVVTPTIGSEFLGAAIVSVSEQVFEGEVDHLLVVDGPEYLDKVNQIAPESKKLVLPNNVGAGGFYGHRVYAAMSHLLDSSYEYVLFLDEDNWFSRNHVQTCVDLAKAKGYDFSYSLRSFYTNDGEFFEDDNCASLGQWKIWDNGGHHLVDTNAYCFRREFLEKNGHLWHNGYAADRIFYGKVKDFAKHGCTGLRTVAYRLGSPDADKYNEELEFILANNKFAADKYSGVYPWELSSVDSNHEPAD